MPSSTKLEKLYRSVPEGSIEYQCLEIHHPVMAAPLRYFLSGLEGTKSFRLEASASRDPGASVVHQAAMFEINEPNAQSVGSSSSSIVIRLGIQAFLEVNEILDLLEADEIEFLSQIEIIYRVYEGTETDVAPSLDPPILVYAETVTMTSGSGISIQGTTTNNRRRQVGENYTIEDFPGLITNA